MLEDEWRLIKKHPYYGAQIIRPVPALQQIIPWVYHHRSIGRQRLPGKDCRQNIPLGSQHHCGGGNLYRVRTRMANRDEYSMEEAIAILLKGPERSSTRRWWRR